MEALVAQESKAERAKEGVKENESIATQFSCKSRALLEEATHAQGMETQ